MEVVPTSDGDDDDGVIWYRCPQCQGFLPKLKNAIDKDAPQDPQESATTVLDEAVEKETAEKEAAEKETMEFDSPSEMMAAREAQERLEETAGSSASDGPASGENDDAILPETDEPEVPKTKKESEIPEEVEPIQEYAALLAEVDPSTATAYRPWAEYEVGQCVHHLAWDDCGVVVVKETLPGNRSIIKVYFETAGVVRLIEKAPR
jgi:hypothetical protein